MVYQIKVCKAMWRAHKSVKIRVIWPQQTAISFRTQPPRALTAASDRRHAARLVDEAKKTHYGLLWLADRSHSNVSCSQKGHGRVRIIDPHPPAWPAHLDDHEGLSLAVPPVLALLLRTGDEQQAYWSDFLSLKESVADHQEVEAERPSVYAGLLIQMERSPWVGGSQGFSSKPPQTTFQRVCK